MLGILVCMTVKNDQTKKEQDIKDQAQKNQDVVSGTVVDKSPKAQVVCVQEKPPLSDLSALFKDAQALCEAFDAQSTWGSYLKELYQKETLIVYVLKDKAVCVGFCFLEMLELDYGQLIVHTRDPEDEVFFATELMREGILKDRIVELIQFREGFQLRDAFIEAGCIEKERVKMVHSHLDYFEHFVLPVGVSMLPFNKASLENGVKISNQAHLVRHKEERYSNYATLENRKNFALGLRDPAKNNYIEEASNILCVGSVYVGVLEAIFFLHQKEEMPWIADISILPQYQGKKYGELLLHYSLAQFYKMGHMKAGLSVSIKNTAAFELYKKTGFEESEYFVELFLPEAS